MQELQQIQNRLALLRRGALSLAQMHKHVAELEQLTGAVAQSNSALHEQLVAARQRIRQWQDFFELSLDMLCIANLQGYFLDVNPSFMRVLGYSKEELLQRPFTDFIHPDDINATLMEVAKLAGGADAVNFENRYRCRDGHYVWLAWCCPAPPPGSELLYAIARDVSERKRSDAEILFLAAHDSLTGLFNRAALNQQLQQACARWRRDASQHFSLLYLDLDKFKPINDQYGHQAGDEVLREVAQRLRSHCRDSDSIARLGGDEFVVLAAGQSATEVQELKARIQHTLQQPMLIHGISLSIDVSIGIAQPNAGTMDLEALLAAADQQMYLEKHAHHGVR